MKSFSLYEFSGIILPGAIVLYGLALLFPPLMLAIQDKNITIGDLGLFVILSYASGHLVAAVGNLIEWVWWTWLGAPTDWLRTNKGNLISINQLSKLEKDLQTKLNLHLNNNQHINSMSKHEWFGITRQIYASVLAAKRSNRVDIFNANYGLCRGITASFLILSLVSLFKLGTSLWYIPVLLLILSCVMFFRMRRFGIHYARELFIQFLQLSK